MTQVPHSRTPVPGFRQGAAAVGVFPGFLMLLKALKCCWPHPTKPQLRTSAESFQIGREERNSVGGEGGGRTHTHSEVRQILSLVRLPVPPLRQRLTSLF